MEMLFLHDLTMDQFCGASVFILVKSERAVKQTVEVSVIWDTMTFVWQAHASDNYELGLTGSYHDMNSHYKDNDRLIYIM